MIFIQYFNTSIFQQQSEAEQSAMTVNKSLTS